MVTPDARRHHFSRAAHFEGRLEQVRHVMTLVRVKAGRKQGRIGQDSAAAKQASRDGARCHGAGVARAIIESKFISLVRCLHRKQIARDGLRGICGCLCRDAVQNRNEISQLSQLHMRRIIILLFSLTFFLISRCSPHRGVATDQAGILRRVGGASTFSQALPAWRASPFGPRETVATRPCGRGPSFARSAQGIYP